MLITAGRLIRSPPVRLHSAARCNSSILSKGFPQFRLGKSGTPACPINLHFFWFCLILRHRICSILELNIQDRWPTLVISRASAIFLVITLQSLTAAETLYIITTLQLQVRQGPVSVGYILPSAFVAAISCLLGFWGWLFELSTSS